MSENENAVLPDREPTLRVVPMPADANQHGDIFGGWVMSQVDICGGVVAARRGFGGVVERGSHGYPGVGVGSDGLRVARDPADSFGLAAVGR